MPRKKKYSTLPELLTTGTKLRLYYNPGNINNRIMHIRARVDDNYIVSRTWARGRWSYEINHVYFFIIHMKQGCCLSHAGFSKS